MGGTSLNQVKFENLRIIIPPDLRKYKNDKKLNYEMNSFFILHADVKNSFRNQKDQFSEDCLVSVFKHENDHFWKFDNFQMGKIPKLRIVNLTYLMDIKMSCDFMEMSISPHMTSEIYLQEFENGF